MLRLQISLEVLERVIAVGRVGDVGDQRGVRDRGHARGEREGRGEQAEPEAAGGSWCDAPGGPFKLASEARRIQLAHLFDPYSAVATATIQPLPH